MESQGEITGTDIHIWRYNCFKMKDQLNHMCEAITRGINSRQLLEDMKMIDMFVKLSENKPLCEKIQEHISGISSPTIRRGSDSPFRGRSIMEDHRRRRMMGIDQMRMLFNRDDDSCRRDTTKHIAPDDPLDIDPKFKEKFDSKIASLYDSIKRTSFTKNLIVIDIE